MTVLPIRLSQLLLTSIIGIAVVSNPALAHSAPNSLSTSLPPQITVTTVANHMYDDRWAPGAAVLPDGKRALIVGGYSFVLGQCVASADIFDDTTKKFVRSKSRMTFPRDFPEAISLLDGRVLIAGGYNDWLGSERVCELYDPKCDSFSITGSMDEPRELFQAVRLNDGRVLATGGLCLGIHRTVRRCELYDPVSGTWSHTSSMVMDRFGHGACLLRDGRVFVVGGTSLVLGRKHGHSEVLASAEIYDPATENWTTTPGSLIAARDRPTATILLDGTVLIGGGQGNGGAPVTFNERFDPATGLFTKIDAPPLTPRMAHGASLLPSGAVVLAGGWDADAKASTNRGVLLDPSLTTATPLPPLPFAPIDAAQLTFANGDILVAGGKWQKASGEAGAEDRGAVITVSASGS